MKFPSLVGFAWGPTLGVAPQTLISTYSKIALVQAWGLIISMPVRELFFREDEATPKFERGTFRPVPYLLLQSYYL